MRTILNKKRIKKFVFVKDNFIAILGLILFFGFLFLVQTKERTFYVNSQDALRAQALPQAEGASASASPISGLACENYNRRPIAVMLANDPITRPLSGLAEADMIFEMQVVQNSITRLMAVYVCGSPDEIGSIRSARESFLPLAMGFDAIYAHWGGSHFALDKLNAGIMDNINALTNPFGAFYRKSGIEAPHNGFSSMERLLNSAVKLGYQLENEFEGYSHGEFSISNFSAQGGSAPGGQFSRKGVLKISYSYPYNVEYRYDAENNSYLRWRGGVAETEKKSGQQIKVKNVVVMRANSYRTEGQYNKVEVEGSGEAIFYQNGEEIKGSWTKNKKDLKSKLYFYGAEGEEIKFVPGLIWVEIIESAKEVSWDTEEL